MKLRCDTDVRVVVEFQVHGRDITSFAAVTVVTRGDKSE